MTSRKFSERKLGRYRTGVYNADYGSKKPRDLRPAPSGWRTIIAKYDGTCSKCHKPLHAEAIIWFNPDSRKVRHSYPCE